MKPLIRSGALTALLTLLSLPVFAQGTAFTYQGLLNDDASPANGSYDLRFAIYDALPVRNQQGKATMSCLEQFVRKRIAMIHRHIFNQAGPDIGIPDENRHLIARNGIMVVNGRIGCGGRLHIIDQRTIA